MSILIRYFFEFNLIVATAKIKRHNPQIVQVTIDSIKLVFIKQIDTIMGQY